jgi:hypothetical protein
MVNVSAIRRRLSKQAEPEAHKMAQQQTGTRALHAYRGVQGAVDAVQQDRAGASLGGGPRRPE